MKSTYNIAIGVWILVRILQKYEKKIAWRRHGMDV
jgi:hypothetical protein